MAETTTEHAERIATLEVKMEMLTKSVDDATGEIRKLVSIVEQARGARYALVGLGAIVGGGVAYIVEYSHKAAAIMQVIGK